MGVKVTTTDDSLTQEITYPILGIYPNGTIVLFSSKTTGTILKAESKQSIGHHSSKWAEYRDFFPDANWVPYTGTITLSNEEL